MSPPVSSDFSADEKLEMENIKMYKQDLLDDIQVNTYTHTHLLAEENPDSAVHIQKLKLEIDKAMAEIRNFQFTEEK